MFLLFKFYVNTVEGCSIKKYICSFQPDSLTNVVPTGNSCFWLVNIWKILFSETARPNEPNLDRKNLWKVLYKDYSFRPNSLTHTMAKGNSCFWLVVFWKIFFSETAWPNVLKIGRNHLWKVLYAHCSYRPNSLTNILVSAWLISKKILLWNNEAKWTETW